MAVAPVATLIERLKGCRCRLLTHADNRHDLLSGEHLGVQMRFTFRRKRYAREQTHHIEQIAPRQYPSAVSAVSRGGGQRIRGVRDIR
jgi:hypothetical protein